MTIKRVPITTKPVSPDAQRWLKEGEREGELVVVPKAEIYTARLTVDITPELRMRIKLAALNQHKTMAGIIRQVIEDAFEPKEATP